MAGLSVDDGLLDFLSSVFSHLLFNAQVIESHVIDVRACILWVGVMMVVPVPVPVPRC